MLFVLFYNFVSDFTVTILRDEVRSELQSFYERISILIESSFTHHAPGLSLPPPSLFPPSPEAGKKTDPICGPHSPPPPPSPPPLSSPPSVDIAQTAAHTPTPATDPPVDMVYFF